MTDPFDDLEQALRRRVVPAASAGAPQARRGRLSRWRRGHGMPLIAVAALLTVGGGAVAGTAIHGGPDRSRAIRLASAAIAAHAGDPACQRLPLPQDGAPLVLSDAPVLPAIRRALPWITEPIAPADARLVERIRSGPWNGSVGFGGPLIRGATQVVHLGDDSAMLVTVSLGTGLIGVRDPVACSAARVATLRSLSSDDADPTRRLALRRVENAGDSLIGAQQLSLTELARRPGQGSGLWPSGGTAGSYAPDGRYPHRDVHLGLYFHGGGHYFGLASQRARRLFVQPARKPRPRGVPRSISVHRGFWRLDLPRATGRINLLEVDAHGHSLRRVRLR